MARTTKHSWKSKIDPCLVKTVTFFLDFIGRLENSPAEGLLNFPEDIENLNSLQWHSLYHGEVKKDSFDFLADMDLVKRKAIDKVFEAVQSLDDPQKLIGICSGMVESLPEAESRIFYKEELKRLSEEVQIKEVSDLTDRKTRDFFSVTFSLIVRYLLINLQGKPVSPPDIESQFIRNHKLISMMISFLAMTFSNIAHQKTLYELMIKLSMGDDKSLYKAVTIDKSFLFHEDVKARIIKAQLTGDGKFFKNLGKAISDTPLKK